ncbi:MFS transporter [Brevibacillus dissolubilis]|uniref:MFS transporter n=1 Tax=Brevibacillus dissolubilis TaxID=1844116 RepID=UPI001116508A|nr:MFS transporter [Brevibacillus dissolubilis]
MAETTVSKGNFFQNKFVRVIMTSAILLQVGVWVRNFAILLFVMEQTNNDPYAVSMISVAEFAPIFLFSFIGGTFADRWRPKLTMIWCDILSALSVFFVLFTLMYGSWRAVFFATLVSAILSQFSQPSAMKLFKVHIPAEQLQAGMAMFQTIMAIFMIIGPVLGTYVFQTFGITVSIAVMGVMFLLSAAVLYFLPADQKETTDKPATQVWTEMVDGFRYVLSKKMLRHLGLCFAFAGVAVGILQTLGIFIVVERLGLPKEYLQWMMATYGTAMLIGGGVVMGLSKQVAPQKLLMLGTLSSALTVAGIGLSTNLTLTLVLQFIAGFFFPCVHIGINTLMLKSTEEAFVGRVNGVLSPLFMGMMVISMSLAGWMKEVFSLVAVYEAAGLFFFLAMLSMVPVFRLKPDVKPTESEKGEPMPGV